MEKKNSKQIPFKFDSRYVFSDTATRILKLFGDEKSVEKFMNTLNSMGIVTTVRRELGSDIDAACGQLRKKYIENSI